MSGSERKYTFEILSDVPYGHFELDTKARLRKVNKKLTEILGYSEDELIKSKFLNIFPKEIRSDIKSIMGEVLEGKNSQVESCHLRADGTVGKNYLILTPIYDGGNIVGVDGFIDDISIREKNIEALKESEEKYRSLIERANSGICVVQDSKIKYVNPSLFAMLGYKPEDVIGKNLEDFIAPDERKKIKNRYKMRMAGEKVPSIYETSIVGKNNSRIDAEFNAGISTYLGRPADFVIISDVTQRKNADKALKETKRQFSTLLSNLPGMAYRCKNDHGWTMLYISEGCLELTGYEPSKLIGENALKYADLIHPDDRDYVWEKVQSTVSENRSFRMEYRIITADGREKWVWEQGISTVSEGGEAYLEGFITDINERIKAEYALRESEERYRNLFENSVLGIYRTTPDGKIIMANPSLVSMLGYSSFGELKARNLEEKDLYSEDYPRRSFKEKIERTGKVSGLESAWFKKDGNWVFVRENARAVRDEDGNIIYYEGTVEDITGSKLAMEKVIESEARYRALFEQATEVVFIESLDGIILDVNRRVKDILGYEMEELIGESGFEIIPEEEVEKLSGNFKNIHSGEGFSVESYNLHKDGHKVPVEVNATHLEIAGDSFIMAFVRDITEKKRLEEQLRISQKLEALGRLAGGIAHDFNNLITGIFGYVDLLKFTMSPSDPNMEAVDNIENVAQKATTLTKQLLAFSRKQYLNPEILDIDVVIGDMADMLKRIIGEEIKFRFEPTGNLPSIMADRSQIEQILMNLVINAGDAIVGYGDILVETGVVVFDRNYVQTHTQASLGEHVMLAVSDTGIGIEKENLSRIFEPFFTTKKSGVGTGLGLPMAYGIVKQSGGHIFVYSELNKGTTFKLYFPVAAENINSRQDVIVDEPIDGDETVLVVDDDPDVLNAIVNALSRNGYRVLAAADGREALKLLEDLEGPLHLIITDLVMPKLGGCDLVEIVRDIYPGIKIIYISGYTDKSVVEPELQSAPGEFLPKPFSSETIVKKVREVLDN